MLSCQFLVFRINIIWISRTKMVGFIHFSETLLRLSVLKLKSWRPRVLRVRYARTAPDNFIKLLGQDSALYQILDAFRSFCRNNRYRLSNPFKVEVFLNERIHGPFNCPGFTGKHPFLPGNIGSF